MKHLSEEKRDQTLIKAESSNLLSHIYLAINLRKYIGSRRGEPQERRRLTSTEREELRDKYPVYSKLFKSLDASSLKHHYWWPFPEINLYGYMGNGANAIKQLVVDFEDKKLEEEIYNFIDNTSVDKIILDLENDKGIINGYCIKKQQIQ